MDPRSAAARRGNDPQGALDRLSQRTSADFPRLRNARELTVTQLEEKRRRLDALDLPEDVSVILFGSYARGEVTSESDEDWALPFEAGPDGRSDVIEVERAS